MTALALAALGAVMFGTFRLAVSMTVGVARLIIRFLQ